MNIEVTNTSSILSTRVAVDATEIVVGDPLEWLVILVELEKGYAVLLMTA